MLFKSADDRSGDIAELKALLETKLTTFERVSIEEELHKMQKGAKGEKDAAYLLNFHFEKSEGHLILHDLRIVLSDDRTAQIDHLLVNSFQDFYILESKNWNQLTVEKSGACTTGDRRTIGTESPLEQCKRHAIILKRALEIDPQLRKLAPRPQTIPRVLVSPGCLLNAPHHEEYYVKADIFYSQREKEIQQASILQGVLDLTRGTSTKTLVKIGQALLDLHNPSPYNWREKFGLPPADAGVRTLAYDLVSSIRGLAQHVPNWGDNWFVLTAMPSPETKKALNASGYFAKKERGKWVWRHKG